MLRSVQILAKAFKPCLCNRMISENLKEQFNQYSSKFKGKKLQKEDKSSEQKEYEKNLHEIKKKFEDQSKKEIDEAAKSTKSKFEEVKSKKATFNVEDLIEDLKKSLPDIKLGLIIEKISKSFSSSVNFIKEIPLKISKSSTIVGMKKKKTENQEIQKSTQVKKDKRINLSLSFQKFTVLNPKMKLLINKSQIFVQKKFPNFDKKLKKYQNDFIDLWNSTFPNAEINVAKKIEQTRLKAQKEKESLRELTKEEIEKIQNSIPIWKRNALVLYQDFNKNSPNFWENVAKKVGLEDDLKKIVGAEEYKNFVDAKESLKEFKTTLIEQLSQAHSPILNAARNITSVAFTKKDYARALEAMRFYEPNFDIFVFQYEVKEIFTRVFNAFLKGDLEYIQKTCGEQALNFFKEKLKLLKDKKSAYLNKELLFVSDMNFIEARFVDKKNSPIFIYQLKAQQQDCVVSEVDGKIIEGGIHDIKSYNYFLSFQVNENPLLSELGHFWKIKELVQTEVFKQII